MPSKSLANIIPDDNLFRISDYAVSKHITPSGRHSNMGSIHVRPFTPFFSIVANDHEINEQIDEYQEKPEVKPLVTVIEALLPKNLRAKSAFLAKPHLSKDSRAGVSLKSLWRSNSRLDHSLSRDASVKVIFGSKSSLSIKRHRRNKTAVNFTKVIDDVDWWHQKFKLNRKEIVGIPVNYFDNSVDSPGSMAGTPFNIGSPVTSPNLLQPKSDVVRGGFTLKVVPKYLDGDESSLEKRSENVIKLSNFISPQSKLINKRQGKYGTTIKKLDLKKALKPSLKDEALKSDQSDSFNSPAPEVIKKQAIVQFIDKKMFTKNRVMRKLNDYLKGTGAVSETLLDYKEKLIEYHYQEIKSQLSSKLSQLDFDSLFRKEEKRDIMEKKEMVAAFLLGFSHNTRYKKFCKMFKAHIDRKDGMNSGKIGIIKGLVSVSDLWDDNLYRDILRQGDYHKVKSQFDREFRESSNYIL